RLSMLPLSPRSTLFPYTTLFRSVMVSTIHAVILLNERQCVGVVRGFDPVPRKVVFKLLDLSLELGGVAVARDRIGTVCRYQNVAVVFGMLGFDSLPECHFHADVAAQGLQLFKQCDACDGRERVAVDNDLLSFMNDVLIAPGLHIGFEPFDDAGIALLEKAQCPARENHAESVCGVRGVLLNNLDLIVRK